MSAPENPDLNALARDLRVVIGTVRRRLRQTGSLGELTPSQTAALGRLESLGEATVTDLAREEGVRVQSMGATLAVLQERGFVTTRPDPADGRRALLQLSQEAVARVATWRAAKEDWLHHALETTFTDSELRTMAEAVVLLDRISNS